MSHSPMQKVMTLLVTMLSFTATSICAGEKKETPPGQGTSLATMLDFVPNDRDRAIYKVIRQTLDEDKEGVWSHLRERGVQYIAPQEAILQALRKSLSLRVAGAEAAKAGMALQQAEAVFDPVFQIDVGRSESTTYNRTSHGPVAQRAFSALVSGRPYVDIQTTSNPEPQIDRMGFYQQQGAYIPDKTYLVSKAPARGPTESYSGTLAINQQLPWGPQLRLTHGLNYRYAYYDDEGRSYDKPYAANLGLNLFLPLPFTKNFGRFAPQDVAQEQARIAGERGNWVLRALIENTLLEVDLAYWGLVQSLENLMAAIENRRTAQKLAGDAKRLLDAGRITQYGKNQRDAEFARAKVLEEQARDGLITASYNLGLLVENETETTSGSIWLPAGYLERLTEEMKLDAAAVRSAALDHRAELKISGLDVEARQLNLRLQENQALPDLTLTGGITHNQNNATYGYGSYVGAAGNLYQPDARNMNASLSYWRPIGNRAAKAGLAQAREVASQSELAVESTRDDVTRQVDDALANLDSARIRKTTARRNEELADQTLSRLQARSEAMGDVAEQEITLKLRDLLAARTTRVAAQVDAKRYEALLLAAQGVLAANLAEETALNTFDQYRIHLLAESKAAPFFAPFGTSP